LGPSDTPDPQNSHKGIVYNRDGNKILEGFGILSGDGSKIAMHSPEKITIIGLPNKQVMKEIPIQVNLQAGSNTFFVAFSYNGRYLVARKGNSVMAFDLQGGFRKEISLPNLGKLPEIYLTRDGKYLLIHSRESGYGRIIYFYQLF
jgi:hypothetical protein